MGHKLRNRWITPSRRYSGSWRQNPWINAIANALHAQGEAKHGSTASIATDWDAVRTWENEGGSLGRHSLSSQ